MWRAGWLHPQNRHCVFASAHLHMNSCWMLQNERAEDLIHTSLLSTSSIYIVYLYATHQILIGILLIQVLIILWVSVSNNNLFNGPTLMCPPCSSSTSTCSLAWLRSFQTGRLRLGEHPPCHPALKASGPFPKPCPHSPAWYPPPSPHQRGWESIWQWVGGQTKRMTCMVKGKSNTGNKGVF